MPRISHLTPKAARLFAACGAAASLACPSFAQAPAQADREARLRESLAAPRPIDAASSYWIEELTWMEIRDLIKAGATTVILPTGGIEQNGPYLATGKHNIILREICPAIASKLGGALCAPVVGFVPEGSIDPPTGLMRFPGTISVRENTFVALVTDIANSLKQHGFRDVVLIGDSGGNQEGLGKAAAALNADWKNSAARAHFIEAFYEPGWTETERHAEEALGVTEPENDGLHDDIYVTTMLMASDPRSVRHEQRLAKGLASINGVDISDIDKSVSIGKKLIEFRATQTADAINAAIRATER